MSNEEYVGKPNRMKFIFGGIIILAAVVYLITTATASNLQYYVTVDELLDRESNYIDKPAQVIGAVIGDSIAYDAENLTLKFVIAHLPADQEVLNQEGGLAMALNQAVNDPNRNRIEVVYYGVKPDLLQNEAQAIITGRLGEDGIFYAEELLLKCPTKYDAALSEQPES